MRVSTIIPTFNRVWSLPRAVESCRRNRLEQEIIVVDDGSTDGTSDWLAKQSDLVFIRQNHWGKDWAVNLGFEKATGDYVRVLDSDDELVAGANDLQSETAERTGADVIVAGYIARFEGCSREHRFDAEKSDDFIAQQLGEGETSHYSAFLFRRNFILGIPHRAEFGPRDDRMFVIEVSMREPLVAYCCEPTLVHWHHNRGRLQATVGAANLVANCQYVAVYKNAVDLLRNSGKLTERRRRAAARAVWPAAHWIARSHFEDGCAIADWVTQLDPAFRPGGADLVSRMQRWIGFRRAERLFRLARVLRGSR
jgi:glycosyltransferase involved in cell wall biosynthesis